MPTGIHFGERMGFDKDQGSEVSFDRPERSPCIAAFADPGGKEYREALAIIRAGRESLAQYPREDMEGCVPCPLDQQRERKYERRMDAEAGNREAIAKGLKRYDE